MSFVLKDATVVVDGYDLSSSVQEVAVTATRNPVEITPVGSPGRVFTGGIMEGVFTVRFLQDFARVAEVLQPLFSTSTFPVSIRTTGSPAWAMEAQLLHYEPVAGSVGDAAVTVAEFIGAITVEDTTAIVGVRAAAAATARPGLVAGAFSNVTIVGVRASMAATAQAGSLVGFVAYGSGIYGAGLYGGGTPDRAVAGTRVMATATAQAGTVLLSQRVIGVRAAATGLGYAGEVGMFTGFVGPVA